MKTDAQLKTDVISELEWDPVINPTNVGVAVRNGIVTLTGHLGTFAEKHAIERAVQRVSGVKATAVELDVVLSPDHHRSDADIAAAAETAIRWNSLLPTDRVRLKVEKGWITLSGEVDWDFQRTRAEKVVRPLIGVVGVSNSLTLRSKVAPANITNRIRDALTRQVEREANAIDVKVTGDSVTLRGKVHSWTERAAAQGAAWSAAGIRQVVNELEVVD
ncbi:MAG: BON domain-containing protein [Burkholderiales bacterium]